MRNLMKIQTEFYDTELVEAHQKNVVVDALEDMQARLHLAGDEQLRMEDEGGISLNARQTAQVNSFFNASKNIKKILIHAWHDLPSMTTCLSIVKPR